MDVGILSSHRGFGDKGLEEKEESEGGRENEGSRGYKSAEKEGEKGFRFAWSEARTSRGGTLSFFFILGEGKIMVLELEDLLLIVLSISEFSEGPIEDFL